MFVTLFTYLFSLSALECMFHESEALSVSVTSLSPVPKRVSGMLDAQYLFVEYVNEQKWLHIIPGAKDTFFWKSWKLPKEAFFQSNTGATEKGAASGVQGKFFF